MSELLDELAALRRDVEDLKARLAAAGAAPAPEVNWTDAVVAQMRKTLAQRGKEGGLGIVRAAVLLSPNGRTTGGYGIVTYLDADDLPSDADMIDKAAFLGDPLRLRVLRHLAARFFAGEQPLRISKSELAALLGVEETVLEEALRPFVASDWLRWGKTADGDEFYEYVTKDASLVTLTLP